MLKRPTVSLAFLLIFSVAAHGADGLGERLEKLFDEAEHLTPLRTVAIAHEGALVAERGYRGHSPARAANIKSASKSIISALVGIAIDKGVLQGTDQKIAPLLQADLPADVDPRLQQVTIGHLLSMQAGLGRT
ncbi:MAG: serine hydrolase, partial [Mesorhizobium sp.]